ncbi:MAG: glycoside hydrolase family 3 C-terminal domain-containing protein [Myxococcota bacterium]
MARESLVLMKNNQQTLPIERQERLLVVGPLADSKEDMLSSWKGLGEAQEVVTVLEALRARSKGIPKPKSKTKSMSVDYAKGCEIQRDGQPHQDDQRLIAEAVRKARQAEIIIAVVGERADQSGEAKNRTRLDLPGSQLDLVRALAATGKPVVAVLITGRALAVPELVKSVQALLHTFVPGIEAGNAVADVLLGDFNPGGKQPVTWPRSVGQVPIQHYDQPNGRPNIPERSDYKARWLDEDVTPLFPFGHGLSYTRFGLAQLEIPAQLSLGENLNIRVRVRNEGNRAGSAVVQLYIKPRVASTVTARRLQGYQRLQLDPGQERWVDFSSTRRRPAYPQRPG